MFPSLAIGNKNAPILARMEEVLSILALWLPAQCELSRPRRQRDALAQSRCLPASGQGMPRGDQL